LADFVGARQQHTSVAETAREATLPGLFGGRGQRFGDLAVHRHDEVMAEPGVGEVDPVDTRRDLAGSAGDDEARPMQKGVIVEVVSTRALSPAKVHKEPWSS
jgi:hypothetical protein